MKKLFLFFVLVHLFWNACNAQSEVEYDYTKTSKIDHDEMLSEQEVILLNHLLKNLRDTFDFHGKKVSFITGSSGSRLLSKADYFTQIKPWLDAGDTPQISMVLLTEEEKDRSGGYDVLVLSWIKIFTEK